MNPLGSPPTALPDDTPRFCGIKGAGARLGSPTTPGVDVAVRPGPADDAAEESAERSGFVGFLR